MAASTGENEQGLRAIVDLTRAISIVLLALHFYFFCYGAFHDWKLTWPILDRLLANIQKTGLFSGFLKSKLIALGFLLLSTLGARGRKTERLSYRGVIGYFLSGFLLYFASPEILYVRDLAAETATVSYISLTAIGYLLILTGAGLLTRIIRRGLGTEVSNKENETFPQEERLLLNDYSINLPTRYNFRGNRAGWINIINGRRGVLIAGSPGSGKSWFVVEPILRTLSEKKFTQFIYDYKYPDLTQQAYYHFLKNRGTYPIPPKFYYLNFTDLAHSHRCNPLAPGMLTDLVDAIEAAKSMLLSINKTWAGKQGEFFVESPINLLAAVFWFLRNYADGRYCTLPHAIELLQLDYDSLFTVLNTEPEISNLVATFISTYLSDVMETLESQMASVRIPMGRLSSPQVYYLLSGNDFTLDINNPTAPKIVCLGNDPLRSEALSPILSLFCDRLNKVINQKRKAKCATVYDEFATIRAASVQTVIQVGRSNNIMPIIVIQDFSQLKKIYSREEAEALFNMAGNLICGQVNGETAKLVADRFPRIMQDRTSLSINSTDTSISRSRQLDASVPAATISNLSSGEFVGIMADDPSQPIELKAFHARILNDPAALARERKTFAPLPIVRKVSDSDIKNNFQKIKGDVQEICEAIMEELSKDTRRSHLIINKPQ